MFVQFKKLVHDCLTDTKSGRYSLVKVVAALGAISSTVFMWKLILLGGFSEGYFMMYLAYASGQHAMSKYLDNKTLGTLISSDNSGKEKAE